MFNLISPEQKKEIKKEYRFRLCILVLLFLMFTGVVVLVLLTPSFFSVSFKYANARNELTHLEAETPELKNIQSLEETVQHTNEKLALLKNGDILTPFTVWNKVTKNKPVGVTLTTFDYHTNKEKIVIALGGIAATRDALTLFSKNLQSEESFTDVHLPVSNLAKERNVDFSITFNLKE